MMQDLQDELAKKKDKIEAQRDYDDLLDRINNIKPSAPQGSKVSDADIAKWNGNIAKTNQLEEEIAKLKKELGSINGDQLRHDINQLNMTIVNLVSKEDFTKLQSEVAKNKLTMQDLAYALKNLTARVDDLEKKLNAFEANTKYEMGKQQTEIEKLQQGLD